jgi:RNA polymerase sigma-70 factor (ECF subfamily)
VNDDADVSGEGATQREVEVSVAALVQRGAPAVYRYLSRLTGGDRALTEDLTQEVCLALVRHTTVSSVEGIDIGWMIVVARRRFADHLRRSAREQRLYEVVGASDDETEPDWTGRSGDALACLGRLDARQRAALVFRYVDDLPVREVASLLGLSNDATESLLARARHALARIVTEVRHG